MALFERAGAALVTPSKGDGEVNHEKLEEIVEEQIADGAGAIITYGTTGEASTMTREEYLDAIEYICRMTKKRAPVVTGTDLNCTEITVYLPAEAGKRGAGGLLLVLPYYNKATQKGPMTHSTVVAGAAKIPAILYNIPGRIGVTIKPETITAPRKDVDNIVGIKEANGNFSVIATLMSLSGGKMDLYSGNDDQIVLPLSLRGKDVISVLSNMAPCQTHDICASYLTGNVKTGASLQLETIPLIAEFSSEVNPIPVKAVVNMMGRGMGPLRMPLIRMEPQNQEKLKKAMVDYGIP